MKATYKAQYTVPGMRKWLQNHEFIYKRPATVPGKLDPQKQEEFIPEYVALKENLKENEALLFIDAMHPEYQSRRICGWIKKGETKHLQSTAKQTRLHFIGAIELNSEADSHEITTMEVDTVDFDTSSLFFDYLLEKYKDKETIYLISDNGRSFKSKKIDEYLEKNKKIKIIYLPPYSPNLNPIERLWKVVRENTQYNKYYSKFKEFEEEVRAFFNEKIHLMKNQIYRRINDNFQKFNFNLIKTAS